MNNKSLLVFEINSGKFAIDTQSIDRITPAVKLVSYPDMPPTLQGLVNFGGIIIPVINLEYMTERKSTGVDVKDYFIIFNSEQSCGAVLSHSIPKVEEHFATSKSVFDDIKIKPELVENAVIIDNEIVIELSTKTIISQEMLDFIYNATKAGSIK